MITLKLEEKISEELKTLLPKSHTELKTENWKLFWQTKNGPVMDTKQNHQERTEHKEIESILLLISYGIKMQEETSPHAEPT